MDPVYIINVFFMPLVAMYVYKKRSKSGFAFSFETVCQYAVVAVLLLLSVKIPLKVFGLAIHANETAYTIIALAAGCIGAVLFEIIAKNFKVKLSIDEGASEKQKQS